MKSSNARSAVPAWSAIAPAAIIPAAMITGVLLSGLTGTTAFDYTLLNSSEQHCGGIGEIAVRPGISGAVVVENGNVSCPEALAVVDIYLNDPNTSRFNGWDCGMNFHPFDTAWGALIAECFRGPDHQDSILVLESAR